MNLLLTVKDLIGGLEYGEEIPTIAKEFCENHNIVIVYGHSDDLMEFDGAIYDEVGAYGGGVAYIKDGELNVDEGTRKIELLWRDGNIAWTFKTDIKHETFNIMEDGEIFCVGIIFELPVD
jgi:hypothetical protein